MQIFNDEKIRVGTLFGYKEYSITETLDSGDKTIEFYYPSNGVLVESLKEEYYIRTQSDEYVLKAVERGEKYNKYTAVLNVEELEGKIFPFGFESQEQTVKDCLEFAFEETGWTIGQCDITKRRTIDEQQSTTAWKVLQKCLSTYRCECIIDSLNKKINIYERIGSDKGAYFIEGLNLKKLSNKSDTYEFYTRIYPIGKDGITPKAITGKDYIDNNQYSRKIKSFVWKDDRYTNTTSLIEDATAKLDEISRPCTSYTADVIDLAKESEKYKNILSYRIGDTITIISKTQNTREVQRIVKITKYPGNPQRNTVEISNAKKTFAEIQKTETELAKQEAISISNSNTKKVLKDGYYTKKEVESYVTAAEEEIIIGVNETLKSYSTKEEMSSKIQVTAEGIANEVSKKVGNEEVISKINQSAEEVKIQAEKIELTGSVTVSDLSEEVNGHMTQITKDTVDTEYVNALEVKAGSVDAENISGKTIKGKNVLTANRTTKDEDVTGLYIGENGEFDFCWFARKEIYGSVTEGYCHIRMDADGFSIILKPKENGVTQEITAMKIPINARISGRNVGAHIYINSLVYDKLEYSEA